MLNIFQNLLRHPVFSRQYYELYEENFMQIPLHFSTVFLTLVNSSLRSILQEHVGKCHTNEVVANNLCVCRAVSF